MYSFGGAERMVESARSFGLIRPACVLLICVLGACGVRPPPSLSPSPSSPPSVSRARAFLDQLHDRRQTLVRVRGLARVSYAGPHGKGTARQAIAIATPDRFRFELFSALGLAALTSCNGRRLAAYFPHDKVVYRGQADPLTIARFTQVLLSAREVVNLLRGVPALPPPEAAWSESFDRQSGWHRLELSVAEVETHRVWFDPTTSVLRRWDRLTPQGQLVSRVDFGRYQTVQRQAFPFEISLSDVSGRQQVTVVYEQVELDPVLSDELFSLGLIPGVQEVWIDPGNVEPRQGRSNGR